MTEVRRVKIELKTGFLHRFFWTTVCRCWFPWLRASLSTIAKEDDYLQSTTMVERKLNRLTSRRSCRRRQNRWRRRMKVNQIPSHHRDTNLITYFSTAEVLLLDNDIVVFKAGVDCKFFVVGSSEEVSDSLLFFALFLVLVLFFFILNTPFFSSFYL